MNLLTPAALAAVARGICSPVAGMLMAGMTTSWPARAFATCSIGALRSITCVFTPRSLRAWMSGLFSDPGLIMAVTDCKKRVSLSAVHTAMFDSHRDVRMCSGPREES
jgi:hypothetical protein